MVRIIVEGQELIVQTSPGEMFTKATTAIAGGDVEGWLSCCRDDVLLEFPYAPSGQPSRVEGRTAVGDYLRALVGQVAYDGISEQCTHQTLDPDTAIIEWTAMGVVKATGAPYQMSYVVVLTLVDGLIATYRDYWNPITVLEIAEQS